MKGIFPYVREPLPAWLEPAMAKVFAKMRDDATGHDFLHAVRVMELASDIARELEANVEVAAAAGLLHDYYRKEEKQTGRLHFGPEAIDGLRLEFGPLLVPALGEESFSSVLDAVSRHEHYGEASGLSRDARILQDADRLEALGAVGIARTFMFGGAHGLPMIEAEDRAAGAFDPQARPRGSVHLHFYEKLLTLAEGMHTAPGKRMAAQRHDAMAAFLKQFEDELGLVPPLRT